MDFRKSRRIMTFLVVGGGIFALLACAFAPTKLIFGLCLAVAAAAMAAGFIVGGKYYRCPHCGKTLMASRGAVPPACPHCNEKLK